VVVSADLFIETDPSERRQSQVSVILKEAIKDSGPAGMDLNRSIPPD